MMTTYDDLIEMQEAAIAEMIEGGTVTTYDDLIEMQEAAIAEALAA